VARLAISVLVAPLAAEDPLLRRGPTGAASTTRDEFVVDCGAVLRLAAEGIEIPAEHELLAPTLLRSQTLSALHESVHAGELPPAVALERLRRLVPCGSASCDAVLRRSAWDLAEQLGWAPTYDAEYVALTQLQVDALVTLDADLARHVEGIVPTAKIEALGTV
jgi:predicted nucleic acid-binding protein